LGEGEAGRGSVTGEIPVIAHLSIGLERLRLFVTDRGLIVAHTGKRGTGALATMTILGKLSSTLEDLLKGGREAIKKRGGKFFSSEEILRADKDNFLIRYDEIVSIELDSAVAPVHVMILTRDEKFQFLTGMPVARLFDLLHVAVGDRVALKPPI